MNVMDFSFSMGEWCLLALCALLIGASKAGVLGAATPVVPMMALLFGAKPSTGVLLPLLCCADILGVALYRRHADWRILARLFPCAAVGVLAGWWFMDRVSSAQLKPVIGAIVLCMVALQLLMRWRQQVLAHANIPLAIVMGLLAGFTTMTANAAGPVMTLYLLALGLDKKRFVGTNAWFFFAVNLFKMPFSANLGLVTTQSLSLNLLLVPCIVAGGAAGYLLVRRMPQKAFDTLMQILAALGAAYLLVG